LFQASDSLVFVFGKRKAVANQLGLFELCFCSRLSCGGSLGFGPAVPPSGDYTMGVDLQKAGLNPQWFDEGKVNNQFPMSVPGGKLN
jgi:hypothetical protein